MEIIRSQATAWRASHLLTGLSLIFGAAAGLVILVTRTRVASGPLALAGWSLIAIVSSLFSLPFVSESTVVADVAIVGDAEAFDQCYGGFVGGIEGAARPFILIGFFLVAIHQFRSASPLLPRWTSAVAGRLAPRLRLRVRSPVEHPRSAQLRIRIPRPGPLVARVGRSRSEEHTSELQSRPHLVCRLLLEKKKKNSLPSTLLRYKKKKNDLP